MLDVTFLNNVTREKFIKALKNNLYDLTPLLNRMLEKGRVQTMTGRSLLWDVVLKRHSAFGYFSGYDVLASQPINPTVQASLNTANYYATLAISKEEELKNSGNMEKLLDMVKIQFDNAEATLKEQVAKDIYAATTTVGGKNTINGLGVAIGLTNTYANIDRSVAANAGWKSNLDATAYTVANLEDPTNAGYLPQLMRTSYTNASHGGSPDMIFTTKTLYNIYLFIAEANHLRFVDNSTANLSFGGAEFAGGCEIYFDDYCTAKGIYFLNSKDWSVFVFPKANFDAVDDGGSIWRIPTDQLAKIAHIIWMGQMRCDAPWRQAALTALG